MGALSLIQWSLLMTSRVSDTLSCTIVLSNIIATLLQIFALRQFAWRHKLSLRSLTIAPDSLPCRLHFCCLAIFVRFSSWCDYEFVMNDDAMIELAICAIHVKFLQVPRERFRGADVITTSAENQGVWWEILMHPSFLEHLIVILSLLTSCHVSNLLSWLSCTLIRECGYFGISVKFEF